MCGIIGIMSNQPVAREIYLGLVALKNRGANSSGILTYDQSDSRFYRKIGAKSVDRVFADYNFTALKGTLGIGHNRYATSLSKDELIRDAQPIFTTRPGIGLAYNGHLLPHAIKSQQVSDGWNFFTSSDVEFIIHSLSQKLIENKAYKAPTTDAYVYEKLFPAVEDIIAELSQYGSFSVVTILDQRGILAFKDAFGVRPLSYGVKVNAQGHAFASETSAFDLIGGYENIRELDRGEAIFIDTNFNVYTKVLSQKRAAFCAFEPVYFSDVDSTLLNESVYVTRERLGEAIANRFIDFRNRIDRVVAIPRTPEVSAMKIAQAWKKEYGGIIRRGGIDVRTFLEPTQAQREQTAKLKYIFIKEHLKGKRLAVIDDSIVRGTTVRHIVQRLKQIGAQEIHLFSIFPPIMHPCRYGIDTPHKEELIASIYGGNMSMLQTFLEVDSVNYLPLADLVKVLGKSQNELCTACLTGKYLT